MAHPPHGHTDQEPFVVHWSEKIVGLIEMALDQQEWYESLAAELVTPETRVAVDVGCGGGGMTLALATALTADGRVLAVDAEPQLLAAVKQQVDNRAEQQSASRAAPLARVELVTADLTDGVAPIHTVLPGAADLVWASAAVHHVGDQQAAVDALASLLGPGGRLALAEGGLATRNLPWDLGVGEPGLEQRLEAANDRWFARMREQLPGSARMPYGWPTALRHAGLASVTTRTTLRERPAPLADSDRRKIVDRYDRWLDRLRPTGLLDAADLAAWDQLLDPENRAWLGHRDDLYRLEARSVHLGTRRPATRSARR